MIGALVSHPGTVELSRARVTACTVEVCVGGLRGAQALQRAADIGQITLCRSRICNTPEPQASLYWR